MEDFVFSLELDVRDYECDIQGVVNNSVYQNYLEHARHKYLQTINLDFADLTKKGINLMVTRAEIDYKFPLRSGDRFVVGVRTERISALRFGFVQNIYRLSDQKLIVKALVIGVSVNAKGRPELPEELAKALGYE
ncbi:MAG: acyl-CoA thioesterase [Bacteroidetes bacterium]|nr:acyl-CoA thioesterase [Bacteroidota bacterium]